MPPGEIEAAANWNAIKFVAIGVTVALLAGCAVAVPLRPLATSSQNSRDGHLSCSADRKCSNVSTDHLVTIRSKILRDTKVISQNDPPHFIVDSGDHGAAH
jgi:hypothetical protein